MKQTIVYFFIISLFSFSCSKLEIGPGKVGVKKDDEGFKNYKIDRGDQKSTLSYKNFSNSQLQFLAVFDGSASYKVAKENQGDINKLYGFSDCGGSDHHQNSARFGWRWLNDKLEIHAYCYVNGERKSEFITAVEFDKEYEYSIDISKDKYIFAVNNKKVKMDRGCDTEYGSGNYLYPYFGGDEKAPHDITIKIRDI